MYNWDTIKAQQNSTLRIIHECVKRGFDVSITHPQNLTIRDSITLSFCKTFKKKKLSNSIVNFYKNAEFDTSMRELQDFDVIFMRDKPPLDPILLNFLDSVKGKTFIINAIEGLRKANNKIYTAAFYDPNKEFIPTTHVSKNIDYLIKTIKESNNDKMILKPLDGFGGSGVIVIEKNAMQSIKSLLDFYINKSKTESNYVILQDYIEGAEHGDVRVLMLNGKPIGSLRRKPAEGDLRSNISAGGSVEKYKLTKEDKALCNKIGKKLVEDGIFFAGLDIIGGKLIEINVLSPGTIKDINKLYNVRLQEKIVDYLETVVAARNANADNFRAVDVYEN